jgi:hypothetical protein
VPTARLAGLRAAVALPRLLPNDDAGPARLSCLL